ncbi:hypothetical protein HK096_005366 [Nowakowskiella sp. JEL0078]|nr:hypothetical protein HK096_005366 [Nowakowskiella sp. JEL0078]
MFVVILTSLSIGFLPYIDNFAHVGGFVTGIFAGLLLMPTIHYGKWDKRKKLILMIISGPALVILIVFLTLTFYQNSGTCDWCKYINCLPGLPWCESKWALITTATSTNSTLVAWK